jgi:hypothetical protein
LLKLPGTELAALADSERRQKLREKVETPPKPLFKDCRDLILKKCERNRREEVRRIFEKEAFGELERLVTQKILDVAHGLAREELRSEEFLRSVVSVAAKKGAILAGRREPPARLRSGQN